MSYNDKKIAKILVEHCKSIVPRCAEYQEQMVELVVEVLKLEREHAIARTNVAAKIGDQISALGLLVYQFQTKAKEGKG